MQLQKLQKGSNETLLVTERANEIIGAINALLSMSITPSDAGKVSVSEGNVVIDLTGLIDSYGALPVNKLDVTHMGAPAKRDFNCGPIE